jgi:UDP-N-acetylmuramyl pentapeptide phosphotransferase/UDP-N-acetylglucosamine-1-phosphate transferase
MFMVAVIVLALLSLLDDLRQLPCWVRLAVHIAAAAAICYLLALPEWLWLPGMLAVVWMTNLYNFMDGADGLAGVQGVSGFTAYAAGFALTGDAVMAVWCLAAVSACAGFLCFNWPPAKIFMGDTGSIPLGFLAGALGLFGIWQSAWPLWFPLMAFAPFVLDATATLARRALAGKRVWEAHREHVYQRMVQTGYGHRGTTMRWAALMFAGALLGVALLSCPAWIQWLIALAWLSFLVWLGIREISGNSKNLGRTTGR